MVKEIIIAVVGASAVALAGYLLGVKENQVNIANIKKDLVEIKEIGEKNGNSLIATKLFIAQAHPNRDASKLASLNKLQKFDSSEVEVLAGALSAVKLGPGSTKEIVKLPVNLEAITRKYHLSGNDFANFTAVANLPAKDHKTETFKHMRPDLVN